MTRAIRYWLMKSEPDVFSIEDLERKKKTSWDGVRNYQARNFMRDEMRVGDMVLFYHSNATPPGVAGIARVCSEAHPDLTAQNPLSPYYDPKATPDHPVWMMVDVEFVERFARVLPLDTLKADGTLQTMLVIKRGMRLSVQPVEPGHFARVLVLARR